MKAALTKNLLKYGLGLGLLAWVIISNWNPKSGDDPGLKGIISRPLNFGPFFLALLIATGGLLITFVRWHMLVRAVGLPFSMYNAFRLGLVGYFFNTFLPGSVGGDILKAYYIARDQSRRTVAVATVIIDRVVGLWALVWFVAIIGGIFWLAEYPLLVGPQANQYLQMIVRTCIVIGLVTSTIWFVAGRLSDRNSNELASFLASLPKVGGSLAELWRACWMYRKQSRAVVIAMGMSMIGHLGWVFVFHLAVRAFDIPNPEQELGTLPEHMIIVPVGMTAQALFPAPGGVGGGEAAYGELYAMLAKPKANGVAGCLSQRVIFMGLGIIGYLCYSRMREEMPPELLQDDPSAAAAPPPEPLLSRR